MSQAVLSNSLPIPPYSAPVSEFGCNLGTVTYVPDNSNQTRLTHYCGTSALAALTGAGSIVYGLKEANRSIIEFKVEWNKERNPAKLAISALSANAYFQWFMNGLSSVASAVTSLISKSKNLLSPLISFGPIAGMIAAGSFALLDLKELISLLGAKTWDMKEIKTRFISLIANICMFIAPLLMLTVAASNPAIFGLIFALGVISVLCHLINKWDWFQENPQKSLVYLLALIGLALCLGQ